MDVARYRGFTDHLMAWARENEGVVGLVAVGSMAGEPRQADEWSDHDFWVVAAEPGSLRSDLSWLPEPDRIVLSYRETEHGTNVVYEDGHLIEFAVFEESELEATSANNYRVLVDKADIESRMNDIVRATRERQLISDSRTIFGRFVGQLVIGVSRYGRGELLSSESMVKKWALESLLTLLATHVDREEDIPLDNLDPRRRFELAYPSLGRILGEASGSPVPAAARMMAAVASSHLGDVPGNSDKLQSTLRALIDRAEAAQT